MKRYYVFMFGIFLIFAFAVNVNATVIISNGFPYYDDSWDHPSDELEAVLINLQSEIYGDGSGDIHLNLINYGSGDIVETWYGAGVQSIILEEIAGYKYNTTFGWYNLSDNSTSQIFSGADEKGDEVAIIFDEPANFGFYIDPNGVVNNRMYTEHLLNTEKDYQVAIFEIVEADNQYILGWEDLDLNGGSGGDRDYQDMIIRATINPVPEPATILLLGSGLVGLAGFRRKKSKK